MVAATLGNTIGAALLGMIAASMLYGIMVVQAYLYFYNFPNDPLYQKTSVLTLILLSSVHVAFTVQAIYQYVITDFGNIYAVTLVTSSFKLQTTFNVLIILSVNSLYAVRAWKLGSNVNKLWPAFVILVTVGGWGPGIELMVKVQSLNTLAETSKIETLLNALFGYATALDIIIASTVCYYLQRGRSSSTFSSTNNVIFKIMQYVLMCGFLTSACSLSCLITLNTLPNTLVFIGIDLLLPKLYINSYLALLNSRKAMRDEEGRFDVRKMISTGNSRIDRTQTSCGTFEESNGANGNSVALVDYPKIDITVHRAQI